MDIILLVIRCVAWCEMRSLNYMQPDQPDHEDSPAEWLFSARIFANALGHILKDTEGVIANIDGETFVVHRRREQIVISEADEEIKDFPPSTMIWIHEE